MFVGVQDTTDVPTASNGAAVLAGVKRSPHDTRMYRAIELPNKLQALLIHDADVSQVRVGWSVCVSAVLRMCWLAWRRHVELPMRWLWTLTRFFLLCFVLFFVCVCLCVMTHRLRHS